jgi:hypothetical protein
MSPIHSIDFEFDCTRLPEPSSGQASLRLGIQEKDAVVQDVACAGGAATFRFPVEVVLDDAGEPADFRGGYVHGPRGGRFVYLCWGHRAGEAWETISRAKVPLGSLDRAAVTAAIKGSMPIRARIRMSDAQGRPVVATLKADFVEWLVA